MWLKSRIKAYYMLYVHVSLSTFLPSFLHNDYPLAPGKIENEKEIFPSYQTKFADFYNIPIGNVKRLLPKFFDKEIMCFIMKSCNFT